ncbi:putative uncharacterized protein [Bacteroides sp. CAG:598]|nr:putative uncharacterized protein [Bacteroides sp. CAG:598]
MRTNRIIWNIGRYMCLALLVATASSCIRDEFVENETVNYEKGLCFSLYADGDMQLAGTRSAGVDDLNENRISSVDLFLFKNDGSLNTDGYAHANVTTSDEVVYLYKGSDWLSNFREQDGPYTVYALANYKGDTQLSNVQSLDDLKAVVAKDVDVVKWEGMGDPAYTGKTFLMDGKKTVTYAELQSAQGSGQPYVANVPVARAAVKIELTLNFSEDWAKKFMATGLEAQLSNYASITPVLAEGNPLDGDQRGLSNYPGLSGDAVDNFSSAPVSFKPETTYNGSKIRFYTYVNRWDDFINNETMLLIDLPGRYDENGNPGTDNPNAEVLTHNFYKVPIINNAEPQVFQRNTFYQITATVDMKGTETVDVPVELTNVHFATAPWNNDVINVGEGDTPSYLVLSESHVDIRNADGYNELEFYSSSPITSVTIEGFGSQSDATAAAVDFIYPGDGTTIPGAFFVNKDNKRTSVSLNNPTFTQNATNGTISLVSPNPTNVTKRYITLKVTNQDKISKYVVVEQYPLEYIQPIQGYYSYRDDFWSGEGKFDFDASGIFTTRVEVKQTRFWGTSTEIINPSIKNSNSYFSSKVFNETNEQIYQYRVEMLTDVNDSGWSWGSWTTGGWGVETRNGIHNNCELGFSMFSSDDNDNPMMYFITITQTSGSYKIAHPLREEINFGTEQSPNVQSVAVKTEENDNLVSPQFMLASQLGTTSSNAGWTYAREHCANYVETYKIGNQVYHLDDWRLPTSAEIEVIIKYQNNPNTQDVMATVLAGANYYVTKENGSAATGVESGNSVYIRCIRDVLPTDGFMQQINN